MELQEMPNRAATSFTESIFSQESISHLELDSSPFREALREDRPLGIVDAYWTVYPLYLLKTSSRLKSLTLSRIVVKFPHCLPKTSGLKSLMLVRPRC
jgi:hypothetical protein